MHRFYIIFNPFPFEDALLSSFLEDVRSFCRRKSVRLKFVCTKGIIFLTN